MISSPSASSSKAVLFLLAHNDDEFFVLPRIEHEIAAGSSLVCVYTTDGAAYGESSERRLNESRAVLVPRGVRNEDIVPLGTRLGVRDGTSFRSINQLWEGLADVVKGRSFSRIYVPAWEGGHADHDAAHLLAIALARSSGAEVFEFSLYHGFQSRGPLFRCMSLIPADGEVLVDKLTLREALGWACLARRYPSQRRAFLGLLPFCLPQILGRRSLAVRRVTHRNYRTVPHSGDLFYHRRFKVAFDEFYRETIEFIDRFVHPF